MSPSRKKLYFSPLKLNSVQKSPLKDVLHYRFSLVIDAYLKSFLSMLMSVKEKYEVYGR